MIWLTIANMIATLDIRRAHDSLGNEIVPEAAFESGLTR